MAKFFNLQRKEVAKMEDGLWIAGEIVAIAPSTATTGSWIVYVQTPKATVQVITRDKAAAVAFSAGGPGQRIEARVFPWISPKGQLRLFPFEAR